MKADGLINRLSRALGRSAVPAHIPSPPPIDERIVRIVNLDGDVTSRFIESATAARLHVQQSSRETLLTDIAMALRARNASRIALTNSGALQERDALHRLRELGFDAIDWQDCSREKLYALDAGITDVWFAVAETGSLVIRSSPSQGRSVSLVPPLHIAIVERGQIVADLIDAMTRIRAEGGAGTGTVFITGPSKTSDIEMTLVTGVHGPVEVVVLLI